MKTGSINDEKRKKAADLKVSIEANSVNKRKGVITSDFWNRIIAYIVIGSRYHVLIGSR